MANAGAKNSIWDRILIILSIEIVSDTLSS